jgi:hypothetical protein
MVHSRKNLIYLVAAVCILLGAAGSAVSQEVNAEIRYYPSLNGVHVMLDRNLFSTPDGETGLLGRYYANRNVEGKPVVVRRDGIIDFTWGGGSPDPKLPNDDFSVSWRGTFGPVPQAGRYRFTTGSDDGMRVWLDGKVVIDDWRRHIFRGKSTDIELDKGATYDIRVDFFEAGGGAKCRFDWEFLGTPTTTETAEVAVLDVDGEEMTSETVTWASLGSRHWIDVGDLPDGSYTVEVRCPRADKPLIHRFRREHFVWEGNWLGITRKVYPPFTPVEVDGDRVGVVMRRYRLGGLGLWESVTARSNEGGFEELLAGPVHLVLNGDTPLRGSGRFTTTDADRAVYEGRVQNENVMATTRCATEYDGCMRVELKLSPGDAADGTSIDSLRLDIPLRDEQAPLWHVVGTRPIRNNPAGRTPAGEGTVWDSAAFMPAQRKMYPVAPGFVPYIYLGAEERGLCWFADHTRGWVQDTANGKPCLSLHRANGVLTLRVHLVQKPTVIDSERRIVFGLNATPVKPMPENWRNMLLSRQWHYAGKKPGYRTVNWMGSTYWGCAEGMAETYPLGRDMSILSKMQEARLTRDRGAWQPFIGPWSRRHLEGEWPTRGRKVKTPQQSRKLAIHSIRGAASAPTYSTVYWEEHFGVSVNHPERHIFQDEWDAGFDRIAFHPGSDSYVDFQCWYGAEFIRRGIGLYFDNTMPKTGCNPISTTAYFDESGTLRRSARMWWQREYFKRIWVLHQQLAPAATKPIMMFHMTNSQLASCMGFGQTNLDLEWRYGPEPFQTKFSPALLRAESLGLKVGNLPCALAAERGCPGRFGGLMVHEIRCWFVRKRNHAMLMQKVLEFGYGLEDCTVINYWDEDPPLRVSDEPCKWLLLQRDGRLMLLLCTWNENEADLDLKTDTKALGVNVSRAVNVETDEAVPAAGGDFRFTMPGYGVRLFLLE